MCPDQPHSISREQRQLERLLLEAPVAYLGLVEGPPGSQELSRPYVVPLNFAYVGTFAAEQKTGEEGAEEMGEAPAAASESTGLDNSPDPGVSSETVSGPSTPRLFFHTGIGRKTRALAENPHVCFVATSDVSFSAGTGPCEDGFLYRSALVWGKARLLEEQGDRLAALSAIVAKYDPQAVGQPLDTDILIQTQVYEVSIDAFSYKERPRPA